MSVEREVALELGIVRVSKGVEDRTGVCEEDRELDSLPSVPVPPTPGSTDSVTDISNRVSPPIILLQV